jgi:uncharacterized protein DUF5062
LLACLALAASELASVAKTGASSANFAIPVPALEHILAEIRKRTPAVAVLRQVLPQPPNRRYSGSGGRNMKKLRHEHELYKAALVAGVQYAEGRGAVEFEATDSASDKALYVYRLLVHDKIIAPMPEEQVSEKTIRHRLATWYMHQLPKGHPLLE